MSSFEHELPKNTGRQKPGFVSQLSPVEQLPFPDTTTSPFASGLRYFSAGSPATTAHDTDGTPTTQPLDEQDTSPRQTHGLTFNDSPRVTRLLADLRIQTGAINRVSPITTTLRQPTIIRGSGKSSQRLRHTPKSRKWVVNSAIFAILATLTVLTGLAVAPLATGNGRILGIFSSSGGIHSNTDAVTNASLEAQVATQIAANHTDGLDQSSVGSQQTYSGAGVYPYRFSYGQCTFWADTEYHTRTGYYVQWIGNADQWAYGAQQAGWIVSSSPHVYSIIVLQPGVQGAGYYGHVAVVEKINPDGSVVTSNMNFQAWGTVTYWTFKPGPGVSFVWHP